MEVRLDTLEKVPVKTTETTYVSRGSASQSQCDEDVCENCPSDLKINSLYGGEEDSDSDESENANTSHWYYSKRRALFEACAARINFVKISVLAVLTISYLAYFCYAFYLNYGEGDLTGLICMTIIMVVVIYLKNVPTNGPFYRLRKAVAKHPLLTRNIYRFIAVACVILALTTLITEVVLSRPSNLVSFSGVAGIFLIFFLTSTHPHRVNWRPVLSGMLLQYLFALGILRVAAIRSVFQWSGDQIRHIIQFSNAGGDFLFGPGFIGMVFSLFPTIIFVISILTVLEHAGALRALTRMIGKFLGFCLGSSPVESMNASANIFLGPIDALVLVRPFLDHVTPSELHCMMANGMSTVTGSIMALYIVFGVSPEHLLAASVMSAPAALSLAKLAVPETRRRPAVIDEIAQASRYRSVMDAFSGGAMSALKLTGSIVVNIGAVVSTMAMVNATLGWLGSLVNVPGMSLQFICSYVFYPLALSLGVDVQDGHKVAELLGVKSFINELVAYSQLGEFKKNRLKFESYVAQNHSQWEAREDGDIFLTDWNVTLTQGFMTERSEVITTYALCGFANFICVGVIMGCFVVLVPHRKKVIFKYIFRSMVVGNCASFLTACIAGLLY